MASTLSISRLHGAFDSSAQSLSEAEAQTILTLTSRMAQVELPPGDGPQQRRLTDLPNEILIHIAAQVPTKDQPNFDATCRHMHDILTRSSASIKLRIKNREITRLYQEVNFLDFTGVPLDIAMRRYGTKCRLPWSWSMHPDCLRPDSLHKLCYAPHDALVVAGVDLCMAYYSANRYIYSSMAQVEHLLCFLIEISNSMEWHRRDLKDVRREGIVQKPWLPYHFNNQWVTAVMDVVGPATADMPEEKRFDNMMRLFRNPEAVVAHEWDCSFWREMAEDDLLEILIRLEREPLVYDPPPSESRLPLFKMHFIPIIFDNFGLPYMIDKLFFRFGICTHQSENALRQYHRDFEMSLEDTILFLEGLSICWQ
jgi:hypothetical protein